MSCYTILRLAQCKALNKSLIEKCFRQLNSRLYYSNNDDSSRRKQELKKQRLAQRKELKARIIRDIKNTKRRVEEIIERENIWTVPNFICIGRILSTPLLGYLIICQNYQVSTFQ